MDLIIVRIENHNLIKRFTITKPFDFISSKVLYNFVNRITIPENIADLAAGDGIFGLVKYLKREPLMFKVGKNGINLAAGNNNMKMVKYLMIGGLKCDNDGINLAAGNGHMEMVKYLESKEFNIFRPQLPLKVSDQGFYDAIKNNHIDMIKYIILSQKDDYYPIKISQRSMDIAAESGNIKLVEYLENESYFNPRRYKVGNYGIFLAAKHDQLEAIAKYLEARGLKVTPYGINETTGNGQLEMIKYLKGRTGIDYKNHDIILKVSQDGFNKAAENGHLEMVKYLESEFSINENYVINNIIENGHLEMVKYLVREELEVIPSIDQVKVAAENGHIEIIEYLIKYDEQLLPGLKIFLEAIPEMKLIFELFLFHSLTR